MAQLPPKAPNMAPNWPDFNHQRFLSMDHNNNNNSSSSWVDEFLDFSSTKRGCHRRSISDSVAFLENMPTEDESRLSSADPGSSSGADLEGFDDEQLMSMFTDDIGDGGGGGLGPNSLSCSNPSSPSTINEDNNNNNNDRDEKQTTTTIMLKKQLKSEPHEEVESSCKAEEARQFQLASQDSFNNDKIVDPKRIKRILANRQSAQRSRIRKLHYISELERSVTSLQSEVSVLSPRVAFLDQQRMVLSVDNGVLKQRIAALAQDQIFKDAHEEALKREIERLRQVYYQQNLKKMENDNAQMKSQAASPMDTNCPMEKEQLAN